MPDGVLIGGVFEVIITIETWVNDIHFLTFDMNNWFVLDIVHT